MPETLEDVQLTLEEKQSLEKISQKPRILFCVCGSVAAIKTEEIINGLLEFAEVQVVTTEAGQHFFNLNNLRKTFSPQGVGIFTDKDEYDCWKVHLFLSVPHHL